MKIAVVSDTHGQVEGFLEKLKEFEVDEIFHLGDIAIDVKEIQKRTKIPVTAVLGNNESFLKQETLLKEMPWVSHLVLEKKDVLLTHGHKFGVYYGLEDLEKLAKEHRADWVFYGHTHKYHLEKRNGIYYCNPGSASYPRDGSSSFVIWETSNDKIKRVFL